MPTLMSMVDDKVRELAREHSRIIEQEVKLACEKFNCTPDQLELEYHMFNEVKIKIKASHFKITNRFTYHDELIQNATNQHEDM